MSSPVSPCRPARAHDLGRPADYGAGSPRLIPTDWGTSPPTSCVHPHHPLPVSRRFSTTTDEYLLKLERLQSISARTVSSPQKLTVSMVLTSLQYSVHQRAPVCMWYMTVYLTQSWFMRPQHAETPTDAPHTPEPPSDNVRNRPKSRHFMANFGQTRRGGRATLG